MHNNYYLLSWLTKELKHDFVDSRLLSAYSQDKNVLILNFLGSKDLFIQAYLRPDFSCLSFPETQHRAKRNSADLFKNLINDKVIDIVMTRNDRSFYLQFESCRQEHPTDEIAIV